MQSTRTLPEWSTAYTRAALSALPADLTDATPAQVDEVIRTVQLEQQSMGAQLDRASHTLLRALGLTHHSERVGGYRSDERREWWTNRDGETVDPQAEYEAARKLPTATPAAYYAGVETIGDAFAAIDRLRMHIAAAAQIEHDCQAEYYRRGEWTRFYRVDNSNGHVHRTTACRETYATTRWNWPTQLSGGDAQTVVEAAGALTCLTCFPEVRGTILESRPIDPTMFETPEGRDARQAREAEAKAKRDAKIAKGVTPDGSPLTVRLVRAWSTYDDVCEIKTERAAELRLVDALFEQCSNRMTGEARERSEVAVTALVDALAWKRDQTAAQVRESVAAKVVKRVQRGY